MDTGLTEQQVLNRALDQGSGGLLSSSARQVSKVVVFGDADGDGKYQAEAASLATSLTGANNDIDYTAQATGKAGNSITVEYINPGTSGAALSVEVVGKAIKVYLATQALAAALLTTSLTGSNNDLTITAVEEGPGGDDITITFADPDAADQSVDVTVSDTDITVHLATGAAVAATGLLTSDNTNPSDAVAASGTITSDNTNPDAAGTITIGSVTYKFVSSLVDANDVLIGATADDTLANLRAAINGLAGAGTTYGSGTVANTQAQAGAVNTGAHTLPITAVTAGTAGNSIVFTESATHITVSGAGTLAGGAAAETITIGSKTYTFKTSLSSSNQVLIGADANATLTNLRAAINGLSGAGTLYGSGTTANTDITAGSVNTGAHTLPLTAITAGEAGNALATTETSAHLSFGAATLTGGNNGPITSTAAQVATAINNDSIANQLVSAANAAANDGTGVVTALSQTALSGGAGGAIASTADEIKTAIAGDTEANALVAAADHSGNDGSGVVTAMAATALAGGADAYTELFKVKGSVLVALVGPVEVTLVGATATIEHGIAGATTLLGSALTATDLTKRKAFDKSGVLTNVGDTMATTPYLPLYDGEIVRVTPKVANVTAGKINYVLFWKPLTVGATVEAV